MHPPLHTKDNRGTSLKPLRSIPLDFPSLLTPAGCDQVVTALEECHARGFLYRAIGSCNDAKTAVNKCLRAERLERTRVNREQARVKRKEMEERWKEVDENS